MSQSNNSLLLKVMLRMIAAAMLVALIFLTGVNRSQAFLEEALKGNLFESSRILTNTPEKKEITIRNMTKEIIYYTIKSSNSRGKPMTRVLEVGALDRFPGDEEMDITFSQEGETISYCLDPGVPYSFRYDENDVLELYEGSHGRVDAADLAPFVPTPIIVVEKMLELAEVSKNDVLFDLGCGDGRIVIMAAKKYGARGVGIDIDPQRIIESKANAKNAGVNNLVEFRLGDVMKVNFSKATVVSLYLLSESNELLRPLLEKQLKPGTYVVSHNYHIPGWEEKEVDFASVLAEDGEMHDIYVYRR